MSFQVIALISQSIAIEEKFAGQSNAEIINWLQRKEKIQKLKKRSPEEKQLFKFHSYIGFAEKVIEKIDNN